MRAGVPGQVGSRTGARICELPGGPGLCLLSRELLYVSRVREGVLPSGQPLSPV